MYDLKKVYSKVTLNLRRKGANIEHLTLDDLEPEFIRVMNLKNKQTMAEHAQTMVKLDYLKVVGNLDDNTVVYAIGLEG